MKIWYCVMNNGDGSVSLYYFKSKEAADACEDNMEDGWGDPSVDCINTEDFEGDWEEDPIGYDDNYDDIFYDYGE